MSNSVNALVAHRYLVPCAVRPLRVEHLHLGGVEAARGLAADHQVIDRLALAWWSWIPE